MHPEGVMGGSHVGNYYRFTRSWRFDGCDGLVRQNCCRYANQNEAAAVYYVAVPVGMKAFPVELVPLP
jgi:hypothetical protein